MILRRRLTSLAILLAVAALAVVGWQWLAGQAQRVGLLGPAPVPAEYRSLVRDAAQRCPQVPVAVFAAQLAAESGWDPLAESPVGARGIAQFMPQVWKQYGIDGDGDGTADVWNPADAIHSAAELNCINRKLVKGASGKRLVNTLAAYNAGYGAVLKHDGVPPFPETEQYVDRIMEWSKTIEH